MMTIKNAAQKLEISQTRLYKIIAECETKNQCYFNHSGKKYYILRTLKRVSLLPADAESCVDIEDIENRAAAEILNQILPFLCPRCAAGVTKARDILLAETGQATPATAPLATLTTIQ